MLCEYTERNRYRLAVATIRVIGADKRTGVGWAPYVASVPDKSAFVMVFSQWTSFHGVMIS